ncbi:DUF2945 domain-containing protein [Phenylobacterium sp.]|uniref:DUF2945 domain-containing protein n=1 Tax=Phenylobacterium sp. TaxID=1871053 RepID=UPI003BAB0C19
MSSETNDSQDAAKLRQRVISRWDNEGGATDEGPQEAISAEQRRKVSPDQADAAPLAQKEALVVQRFKVGDLVSWNSEAGRVSGAIIRIHTQNVDYKGHTHHASSTSPQYEIKSSKTDHVALHRGEALTRLSD